ncbi:hypothetical protein AVEN_20477-1 [Araneus ventricosus]|uniref:Uncharacterized protein n=1 Tax=Araneus ventricosus TaxID=182803 RepID=A0A4Y2KP53_ARAVE|nr:hypothetical protein AVEN_20477-1 [Araneus ventricosus]
MVALWIVIEPLREKKTVCYFSHWPSIYPPAEAHPRVIYLAGSDLRPDTLIAYHTRPRGRPHARRRVLLASLEERILSHLHYYIPLREGVLSYLSGSYPCVFTRWCAPGETQNFKTKSAICKLKVFQVSLIISLFPNSFRTLKT